MLEASSLNDPYEPMATLGCRFRFYDIALVHLDVFESCN
jgi:hypothetical protein